jgi:hypothetical protein
MINWKKSGWKRNIKLFDDEQPIGAILFKNIWKQDAEAQFADRNFRIAPSGFWKKSIEFWEDEGFVEDKLLATLQLNTWRNGGTITTSGGNEYHWKNENIWNTRWKLEDAEGEVLLRFRERFSWNYKGEVIELVDWPEPDLRYLLILTGIFAVSIYRENASAGAAAS